jgi:hypothetical protein
VDPAGAPGAGPAGQEGEVTGGPPVCGPCAPEPVEACPRLRRSRVAAVVRYAPAWGVAGVRHAPRTLGPVRRDPRTLGPVPGPDLEHVAYGTPEPAWTVAARLRAQLYGVTPVGLAAWRPGRAEPPDPAGRSAVTLRPTRVARTARSPAPSDRRSWRRRVFCALLWGFGRPEKSKRLEKCGRCHTSIAVTARVRTGNFPGSPTNPPRTPLEP